jgi:hypothetical protein
MGRFSAKAVAGSLLVMAQRHGPKPRKKKSKAIRLRATTAYVVPLAVTRSYFRTEIASEGFHRSGCVPLVLCPRAEVGEATPEWVENLFAEMDEVRQTGSPAPVSIPELGAEGRDIDVGLVDIPITFEGPLPLVASNLERRHSEFLDTNLRYLDGLFSGALHDQMILVNVLHAVRPDGTPSLHYHNLVFGLRKEIREDRTLIGPLDLGPLLGALGRRLQVGLVR